MSFESFAITLAASDTRVFRMPAYTKTEEGLYAILPRSGAIRLSAFNPTGGAEQVTVKLKTIFDLEPVTIGTLDVPAGEVRQWPVPVSLGPGDFVTAVGSVGGSIVMSGSVAASPVSPQTANQDTIWTPFTTRRPIDHTIAWAIAARIYGAASAGGYFAGVIDTVQGTIESGDAYQTGERFALLVSPKNLEGGRGTSTGDLQWDTTGTGIPVESEALTRWDGLPATDAIIAKADPRYEVHNYIDSVRTSDPAPNTEQGSQWYLPALDELELLYRHLKPNAEDNRTDSQSANGGAFPSSLSTHGTNPSSDPTGAGYSNSPRKPDESPLDAFKAGGSQTLSQDRYWSTTDADGGDDAGRAWTQLFTGSGSEGRQGASGKDLTDASVRPVRRVVL